MGGASRGQDPSEVAKAMDPEAAPKAWNYNPGMEVQVPSNWQA